MSPELVVLVDDDGNARGTAPKHQVHHEQTPLHLAFSCYVFDAHGRLLLTRRALSKITWPGVWTNSVCGHPGPGERLPDAVRRRAEQELGLALDSLVLVLPRFRYDATMPDGVRENELCPVFVATTTHEPRPDPDEVEQHTWEEWPGFRDAVLAGGRDVSPWCVLQVRELAAAEGPDGFSGADPALLPAAARASA